MSRWPGAAPRCRLRAEPGPTPERKSNVSEPALLVLRNAAVFGLVTLAIYGACLLMIRVEDNRQKRRR